MTTLKPDDDKNDLSCSVADFSRQNRTFEVGTFAADLTQPRQPRCEKNDEIRLLLGADAGAVSVDADALMTPTLSLSLTTFSDDDALTATL